MVSNIIYMLLLVIYGLTSGIANLRIRDWEYWIILGCIIGAFWCGYYA